MVIYLDLGCHVALYFVRCEDEGLSSVKIMGVMISHAALCFFEHFWKRMVMGLEQGYHLALSCLRF
jgi:hypothetical protein